MYGTVPCTVQVFCSAPFIRCTTLLKGWILTGPFIFSPMDMIGFTLPGSICFALLIGITPQAITVVLLVTTFFAIFQHANIKTPQWVGYIIQRPEGHTVHHAKGIHKYNYSDVSIFDIIFGTFYNPKGHEYDTGFYQGATGKIKDMLLFRDINKQDSENAGTTLEPMQKRAYQL